MFQVLAALVPVAAVQVYLHGPGLLWLVATGSVTALACEALALRLRRRPSIDCLRDGSALVTAALLALAVPPTLPWWLMGFGTAVAVLVAKHAYGGLGQNPFNPAMVAFAVCIVSFPALMSQWPSVGLQMPLSEQIKIILGLAPRVDALSGATPLDALKTALKLGEANIDVSQLLANQDIFGNFAGRGWEWVAGGYLLGGLWLWQRKIITWHVPTAFIGALTLISGALWLYNPAQFASPLFHMLSGGAMLGAFFIATDPVSGCTTPRGKLIFGAGAGLLAYIIRVFGGYPDCVAFAVLLMNLSAPLIDLLSQPRIFGMKEKS
jgi:electron transport complex protein RnfD